MSVEVSTTIVCNGVALVESRAVPCPEQRPVPVGSTAAVMRRRLAEEGWTTGRGRREDYCPAHPRVAEEPGALPGLAAR